MRLPRSPSLAALALLSVLGCGDDPQKDDTAADSDTDTDADTDTDTDADSDADECDIESEPEWDTEAADRDPGTVTGRVVDADGNPFTDARVNLCWQSCLTAYPETDGTFEFATVPATVNSFDVVPTLEGYATPLVPVAIGEGESIDLGDVVVRELQSITYLGDAALDLAFEGITVHADPATYCPPLFSGYEPFLGVARGELTDLPLGTAPGDVVGMWFLAEYDAYLSPDYWSFTAENSYGLAAGSQLAIYSAEYTTFTWKAGGTATVSEDGTQISSDEGSGIPILSTLILVAE